MLGCAVLQEVTALKNPAPSMLQPAVMSLLQSLFQPRFPAASFCPQEVTAPKKPALSVEEQVAEAEAAYKKEEAASAVGGPVLCSARLGC